MSHKRTLCNRCKHGNEHHPDRGPCTYGHETVTGGCMCPGFNARKSVPDREKDTPEEIVRAARDRLQAELDRFCAEVKRAWSMKSALDPDAMLDAMGKAMAIPRLEATPSVGVPQREPVGAAPTLASRLLESKTSEPVSQGRKERPLTRAESPKSAVASPQVGGEVPVDAHRAENPEAVGSNPTISESGEAPSKPLSKGKRSLLIAIASRPGITDRQLMAIADYRETSLRTYMPELRSRGFVETRSDNGVLVHDVTPAGLVELGDFEKIPNGAIVARLELGPRKIYDSISRYLLVGRSRKQLTIETGYRDTSLRTYLPVLTSLDLVEKDGDRYLLTELGKKERVEKPPERPKGEELREAVLDDLPVGESLILRWLFEVHPKSATKEEIELATNYKATSVRTYLPKLLAREFVDREGTEYKAAREFFES